MEHLAYSTAAATMSMDWRWLGFLLLVMGAIFAVYMIVRRSLLTRKVGRPRDEQGR